MMHPAPENVEHIHFNLLICVERFHASWGIYNKIKSIT